jgi:hypothetical protein
MVFSSVWVRILLRPTPAATQDLIYTISSEGLWRILLNIVKYAEDIGYVVFYGCITSHVKSDLNFGQLASGKIQPLVKCKISIKYVYVKV